MLIIGTTTINLGRERGEFFCPVCSDSKPYTKKVARQFLTLYFVPLIPLNAVGEIVICDTCRQKFDIAILDYDPEAERKEAYDLYSRFLILLMIHSECVEPSNLDRCRDLMNQRFKEAPTDDAIMELVEEFESSEVDFFEWVRAIGPNIPLHTRGDLFVASVQTLGAEQQLSPEQLDVLARIGGAFGMDRKQCNEMIQAVVDAEKRTGLNRERSL